MTEEQNEFQPTQADQTLTTSITNIINSVGAEEVGLDALIAALAVEVNAVVGTNPTILTTLTTVDNSVKRKLKLILKKNITLEKKLRDAVNFLPTLLPITGTALTNLVSTLTGVLFSISGEESSLGNLIRAEANKINFVANDFGDADVFTLSDLVNINNNAESVLRVILDKNIVLEEKVEDVLRAFSTLGVTATNPTFGTQIRNALAAVISSIAQEESAIGVLIGAEANKLESIISDVQEGEATPAQLAAVNDSVENMLHTILNKNIVLETKLEDVLDFLTPPVTI